MAGLPPLYGTKRSLMPAVSAMIAASSCQSPPVPDVEMVNLPGFFFAYATRSSKLLNGESGFTDQLASEFAACMYCQSSHAFDVEWPITRTNLL